MAMAAGVPGRSQGKQREPVRLPT